ATQVNATKPLPEYPRPQMVRNNPIAIGWQNLNGLWDYALSSKTENKPSGFQGKILVPYAIESALSGVGKTVGKDSVLWYRTKFAITNSVKNKKILLHFGAVDWETEVYLNGKKIRMHQGGYDPFSFDITSALSKGKDQELELRVWDPTD